MTSRRAAVVLRPRQVMLTIRGGVMLAAGIVAAVAAWRLDQPVIAALGAASATAVLGALAWQYIAPAPRVDVECDVDLIDVGAAFTVQTTVARSRTPMDVVWPLIGGAKGVGRRTAESRGKVLRSGSTTFTRRVTPARRGSYEAGPVAVIRWDPFAVTRTAFLLDASATVDVAPAVIPVNARPLLPPTSSGPSHSGRAGDRAMHARTWQPGDQRRDVHWRATARSGTLMTYEHDAVSPDHIRVMVDSGDDALGDIRVAWALSLAVCLQQSGWHALLTGIADGWTGTGGLEPAMHTVTHRDALRRIAARLPSDSDRRWPQPDTSTDAEALSRVVAVVSAEASPPEALGQSAVIVVGAEDGAVAAMVAAARDAGWRAVGAVPRNPADDLTTAVAALAALGRSGR